MKLRLGVVPYLNVEPIIRGLAGDERFEIRREVPSRVAQMLHAGEIDLGMIPSIEYAAGDYAIVPGIAIGSRGAVRSVVLFHRGPLAAVRRVALDSSSRTSVVLLRIVLRERLGREPEYVAMAPRLPEMLEAADAALVIGDPALCFESPGIARLDLGEAWLGLTGRPFVFAFWAGRPGAVGPADVTRLQAALAAGRSELGSIASSYNGLGAGHAQANETYLRGNIAFDLGEAEQAGLSEFYRRAHAQGLIAQVPELRFYADH